MKMNPPAEDENITLYPGGENNHGYVLAFQLWLVLFLIIISFGLLNFIASNVPIFRTS